MTRKTVCATAPPRPVLSRKRTDPRETNLLATSLSARMRTASWITNGDYSSSFPITNTLKENNVKHWKTEQIILQKETPHSACHTTSDWYNRYWPSHSLSRSAPHTKQRTETFVKTTPKSACTRFSGNMDQLEINERGELVFPYGDYELGYTRKRESIASRRKDSAYKRVQVAAQQVKLDQELRHIDKFKGVPTGFEFDLNPKMIVVYDDGKKNLRQRSIIHPIASLPPTPPVKCATISPATFLERSRKKLNGPTVTKLPQLLQEKEKLPKPTRSNPDVNIPTLGVMIGTKTNKSTGTGKTVVRPPRIQSSVFAQKAGECLPVGYSPSPLGLV